jgi:hypothetical protein
MAVYFPSRIISSSDFVNQGVLQSEPSKTIVTDTTYGSVTLNYTPRSRVVLNDQIVPSSIQVNAGGMTYSEVFSLSSLTSDNVFFTDEATKKLYFHAIHVGTVITVSYETKGDFVNASDANNWQNDLRAIELILGSGGLKTQTYGVVDGSNTVVIPVSTFSPTSIDTVIVLAQADSGDPITVTRDGTGMTITLTAPGVTKINYLLLIL